MPVCRTTHRSGGSHSLMIMVSLKPTGPIPVQPTTVAPSPWPPRTWVAQIHSCWRDQSVMSAPDLVRVGRHVDLRGDPERAGRAAGVRHA